MAVFTSYGGSMTTSTSDNVRSLRLWPAVILVGIQCAGWLLVPIVLPDQAVFGLLGGVAAGLGILIWLLFFSRARWSDRFGAIGLMIAAAMVTSSRLHLSISGAGMGNLFYILSAASMTFALVLGAVLGRRLSEQSRRLMIGALILVACAVWTLVRTDGIRGAGGSQFAWRWSTTAEQRLLAQPDVEPKVVAPAPDAPVSHSAAEVAKDTSVVPADKKPSEAPPVPAPAMESSAVAEWPGF